ncbi:MAG: Rho family GTPase [Amphiamblys sp. WSBS2006]|nr:MAG: Rho family GTPase [Amphiamblys sp. WSBS2006]
MGRPKSKKFVIVGDGGCGKTSLFIRKVKKTFSDDYVPTIFENHVTTVVLPGKKTAVEVALWDTAGQEDYDRLRPLSYPDTDFVLFSFSIDNLQSLENITKKWLPEVKHFCSNVPYIVVGLKGDLRDGEETERRLLVTEDHAARVAASLGALEYIECSARTDKNVSYVFERAVSAAIKETRSLAGRFLSMFIGFVTFRSCRTGDCSY